MSSSSPSLPKYSDHDLQRLKQLAALPLSDPEEIGKVIDTFGYLDEWKVNYRICSVHSSLHSEKITCIDAAVLSYGLLELLFPKVKRRLLTIHRRDMNGEECGHCVTLYWGKDGQVGAFSKSSFNGFGHRKPIFLNEDAIARSFAEAYLKMDFVPLYYGVTTLEEAASDLDWRFSDENINVLSDRLIQRYQYSFDVDKNEP
jgi:hypothetical protein